MKNMKLVFIFIFLIMAVTALAYRMYSGIPESGDGTFEESITPDNGGDVRVAGGADKAYMAAEELMANAEFKDAAAALEDAIKEFPGEARFYNLLGQALMYQNNIERAIAAYKKAVAFEPGNLKFIFDLAALQYKVELFEDAAATIEGIDVKRIADAMQAVLAVNICLQNFLPEAGIRWSERALTLLTEGTETYNFILTRKALFLSMLGGAEESLQLMDQTKFDTGNEDKQYLMAALKSGFIRWLGRMPGDREKMLVELASKTTTEMALDAVRLSQALIAMENSKWADAAAFLKQKLPAPDAGDNVTKVFHYLMRQSVNVIVLDEIGRSDSAKSLIEEMKNWCEANSKGAGRLVIARCQAVDLLSHKNDAKEAIDICMTVPPSLTSACLLNAGFGSEMNGDDKSAWELYSKSAGYARYNVFPRKISRVLLKNINESRKAAGEEGQR